MTPQESLQIKAEARRATQGEARTATRTADLELCQAIDSAREAGLKWAEIEEAVGMSRQRIHELMKRMEER